MTSSMKLNSDPNRAMLFNSNSLRDLLGGSNGPGQKKAKKKRGGAGVGTQGVGGKMDLNTMASTADELIQEILMEETGLMNAKRRKPVNGMKKKKKVKGVAPYESQLSAYDKARLSRLAMNNVQSFSSSVGIAGDDVSFIENHYRQIDSITRTNEQRIRDGFAQLVGDGVATTYTMLPEDGDVLLAFGGIDISSDEYQAIFDKAIVNTAAPGMEIEGAETAAEASSVLDFELWLTGVLAFQRQALLTGTLAMKRGRKKHTFLEDSQVTNSSVSMISPSKEPATMANTTMTLYPDEHSTEERHGASRGVSREARDLSGLSHASTQLLATNMLTEGPSVASLGSLRPAGALDVSVVLGAATPSFSGFGGDATNSTLAFLGIDPSMMSSTGGGGGKKGNKGSTGLPPLSLRSTSTINRRVQLKGQKRSVMKEGGYNSSMGRSTPRCLKQGEEGKTSIEELRRELMVAREGLKHLDAAVEENIAWVHSNCETMTTTGGFSRGAREAMHKISTERLFNSFETHLKTTLMYALYQWHDAIQYMKLTTLARSYSRSKAIEIITKVGYDALCRQFFRAWTPWKEMYETNRQWEQTGAAVEIQRVGRGMLGRLRVQDIMIHKSALRIQCMVRKRLARKKVGRRRDMIERAKALEEKRRMKKESQAEEIRLRFRASRRIQAVVRGRQGRKKFIRHKQNKMAVRIQKVARSKQGRARFNRIKAQKEEEKRTGIKVPEEPLPAAAVVQDKEAPKKIGGMFGGLFNNEKPTTPGDKPKSGGSDKPKNSGSMFGSLLGGGKAEKESELLKARKEEEERIRSEAAAAAAAAAAEAAKKAEAEAKIKAEAAAAEEAAKKKKEEEAAKKPGKKEKAKPLTVKEKKEKAEKEKKAKAAAEKRAKEEAEEADSVEGARIKAEREAKLLPIKNKVVTQVQCLVRQKLARKRLREKVEEARVARATLLSKGAKFAQPRVGMAEKQAEKQAAYEKAEAEKAEKARIVAEALAEEARLKAIADEEARVAAIKKAEEDEIARKIALELKQKEERAKKLERVKKEKERKEREEKEAQEKEIQDKKDAEAAAKEAAKKAKEEPKSPVGSKPSSPAGQAPSADAATTDAAAAAATSSPTEKRPKTPMMKLKSLWGSVTGSQGGDDGSKGLDGTSPSRPGSASNRPGSPLDAVMGFFGGRPKSKGGGMGRLPVAPEDRPVYTDEDRAVAATKIAYAFRMRKARVTAKRKRKKAMEAQRVAGQVVWWAVVTIQKIARAKQGNRRWHNCKTQFREEKVARRDGSVIKIQSMVRRIHSTLYVRALMATRAEERKEAQWAAYKKEEEEKKEQAQRAADPEYQNTRQSEEIEEKLKKLDAMEKAMSENQTRMEKAAAEAEKRAKEMEAALKAMNDRAAQEEAERVTRRELMMMAAGSIPNTQRTDQQASTGPAPSARVPESARHSAPPSARSARGGAGIPAACRRIVYDSREWCELWDPDEEAYYWYCELTQEAQWDNPLGGDGDEVDHAYGAGSGYQSEGGKTDYSSDGGYLGYDSGTDKSVGGGGAVWQEFWDEQAQAKYWYNSHTGEASWTQPSGGSAKSGGSAAPAAAGGGGGQGSARAPGSARDNPKDWVSYVDEATGQEYWYNAKTGETSWA